VIYGRTKERLSLIRLVSDRLKPMTLVVSSSKEKDLAEFWTLVVDDYSSYSWS
jgi:hypothetical protein